MHQSLFLVLIQVGDYALERHVHWSGIVTITNPILIIPVSSLYGTFNPANKKSSWPSKYIRNPLEDSEKR